MTFKKGGRNRGNLYFTSLKLLNVLSISLLFFTTGGSFNVTYDSLHGQAFKWLFTLKSYLIRFPNMTVIHKCIFSKSILGVRSPTNTNFVYDELGRYPLIIRRIKRVIKY